VRIVQRNIKKYSDEQLMQLLSGKHQHAALTELHARYAHKILGYFIRMFQGDEQKAQDHVQEVFIRVLSKHHLFDATKKFYTWVFTIASNLAKTSFREGRSQFVDVSEIQGDTLGENELDKKQFLNHLSIAVDALEPNHREAFTLRHIQGLGIAEISEITEAAPGTVKSRIYYATRKIAELLKEYKPENGEQLFKIS